MAGKSRILYVYKILIQETDPEHYITINQIIQLLKNEGISAYRKTVIKDIEQLSEFGADIIKIKSTQNRYYIRNGFFTLAELKLLVDIVEASQFITQSKSADLICRLGDLTSNFNAEKLCRHIYLTRRMKTDNEEIYDIVDKVHTAINKKRQISFLYYDYNVNKELILRNNGERYQLSPYGMTWEDSRYYVVGYSIKHKKIVTFRADRMSKAVVTDNPVIPKPKNFSIAEFTNKVFRMYDDEISMVILKCKII